MLLLKNSFLEKNWNLACRIILSIYTFYVIFKQIWAWHRSRPSYLKVNLSNWRLAIVSHHFWPRSIHYSSLTWLKLHFDTCQCTACRHNYIEVPLMAVSVNFRMNISSEKFDQGFYFTKFLVGGTCFRSFGDDFWSPSGTESDGGGARVEDRVIWGEKLEKNCPLRPKVPLYSKIRAKFGVLSIE